MPYFLLLPAGIVLFPSVADVARGGDRERLATLVRAGFEGAVAVVVPFVAVLAAAPGPALDLLVGHRYAAAAGALRLLAIAMGLLALAYALGSVLGGAGHGRQATTIAAAALVVEVALAAVLARRDGLTGAAAATAIATGLAALGLGLETWHRLGSFVEPTRLARLALAGVATYLIAARASGPLGLLVLGAAGCGAYGIAVVALRVVPRALVRG